MQFRLLHAALLAAVFLMALDAFASHVTHAPAHNMVKRQVPSLQETFQAKHSKYMGTCFDVGLLANKGEAATVAKHFGVLTPENSMKWDATQPTRGKFDFEKADAFMKFAKSYHKNVRGHTLIWYSQLSGWVSGIKDKTEMMAVMKEHIQTVMGRYRGQIYAWDVVNEPFEEDGSFRKNPFYNALGADYIPLAFKYARAADPKAKLYINDYNLDSAGYAKTKSMIAHVKTWRAAGVPIDGIGSQTHLSASGFPTSDTVRDALKSLCSVVPECAVTELDIKGAKPESYAQIISACTANKNCVGVTVWGVRDIDSWRASNSPLLFDANFKPKPAFYSALKAMAT